MLLLFSCSVVSNFLQPHGLQQTGFPCYSPAPRACSNSCPLIESVMPSNYRVLCCPRLLLPSIFPSIRVFSKESALHIRWPKYWNFSFSISSSNEYSGLISFSFKIDWFDLADQGTLESLLQYHSSNASNDKMCIIIYYYFMYCLLCYRPMECFFIISKGYYTSQLSLFSFFLTFLLLKIKKSIPFRSLHGQRT